MWPRALRLDGAVRDPNALHMMMLEKVYQRAADFDVLHFHLDYYPFSLFSRQPTPFVTTLHGRLDLPEHQPVFDTFCKVPVVSISNAQRRPLPQAHWVRTVLHGLPEKLLMPKPVKPDYFAFLGRIAPEKGIDRAIRIAQHCGVKLKVAAKVDRADQDYYDEQIKPMIQSGNVEFIGEINDKDKSEFLSGAIVAAGADRLAGAIWLGDDRSHGLRYAGHCVQSRLGAGSDRRRASPASLSRTSTAPSERSIASAICRAKISAGISSSASPRGGWRRIISASTAALRKNSRRICGWSPTTRRLCSFAARWHDRIA